MAEIMFPLENTDYSASDAQLWFATRLSGVYTNGHLSVYPEDGMQITVAPGIAWLKYGEFAGAVYGCTEPLTLEVPISDGNYPRIDRVVVRYDAIGNHGKIAVKTGTPASYPEPPALNRDENYYELSLAQIYVGAGAVEIFSSDITDERFNESVCGLMRDGVTGIDTSVIYDQFLSKLDQMEAETQEFISVLRESYEAAISGTLAGNLQADISALRTDVTTIQGNVSGLQTNVAKKAEKFYATATIGTTWTGSGPYSQIISVPGMLSTDTPIIDLLPSVVTETAEAEIAAWAVIYRIDTANGSLTVYASEATTQAITIQILGVR